MDIVREFRASNTLLRALRGYPPGLLLASQREASRIQGLLRTNAINTLVLAELARTVDESLFHDEDKELLLKAIANTSTEAHAPPDTPEPSRTKSQNWSCVIHKLLPEIVWKSLVDERVELMFEHLGRLGLRLPDERTFRSMAIAFLWASNGSAKFASMSPCARLTTLRALKSMWAIRFTFQNCRSLSVGFKPHQPTSTHSSRDSLHNGTLLSEIPRRRRSQ